MRYESSADIGPQSSQKLKDQPQILAGTAKDDVDGIALSALEVVAAQQSIVVPGRNSGYLLGIAHALCAFPPIDMSSTISE